LLRLNISETFDSKNEGCFGNKDFTGAGIFLNTGFLWYPDQGDHIIIDKEISKKAKEIIVILTISNNGTKKEIRFLCDGKESVSSDVSEVFNGDFLFPTIVLGDENQQVTTIPFDQIKTRTPEIERLIFESEREQQCRFQLEELTRIFLQQHRILLRGLKEGMRRVDNSIGAEGKK
jgi:hypothetical protein